MLSLLIPLAGIGQSKEAFVDDIYFTPSDAKIIEVSHSQKQAPKYKNGAKEIIYIEREVPTAVHDTVYVVGQANDSSENLQANEQQGNESDLEYADRIRRFHNPSKVIYIMEDNQNFNYGYNNYGYNGWDAFSPYNSWGNNWCSPYSSFYSPWGYNSWNNWYGYGSGFGFGGYYGY
ncbi:MAG: hypothetical protein WCJ61_15775, partial [Paludibacter sp.]